MCLRATELDTNLLVNKMNRAGGKLRLWKIYKEISGKYYPPYRSSYCSKSVEHGEVISNSRTRQVNKQWYDGFKNIYNGIHVFRSKKEARFEKLRYGSSGYWYVYPVICDVKDLIAASNTQAVFRKIVF